MKVILGSLWTFAYLILALVIFDFSQMGDCMPDPEGAHCHAVQKGIATYFPVAAILGYFLLTWLIFVRGRAD